jgi:hypothetical protein
MGKGTFYKPGDIVIVKSGTQGGNGNGISNLNQEAEIVDYDLFNNAPGTSGLIDGMYEEMYIVKFENKGFMSYRRIIGDHVIKAFNKTPEDLTYLISFIDKLNE